MKRSAGLLMYRKISDELEVFLVHPGGPRYEDKDDGWWSIPKGEIRGDEDPLEAAIREFVEETGFSQMSFIYYMNEWIKRSDDNNMIPLEHIVTRKGKIVHAWAFEGNFYGKIKSNSFEMEWPPKSGKIKEFPEVDKGQFFTVEEARKKLCDSQAEFVERLLDILQRV